MLYLHLCGHNHIYILGSVVNYATTFILGKLYMRMYENITWLHMHMQAYKEGIFRQPPPCR